MKPISYLRNKLARSTTSPLIGLIVCFFGCGSWVAVNGLFVQLPILVQHAPEGWNLPSYLIVVIQLGNLGPLLYSLGTKFAPRLVNETVIIHIITIMAVVASILLALLWRETTVIAGKEHSTALLVLVFFLALMACTSSLTFLPFMGKFKPEYIVTFFVGQGVSGLLPSVVALIQGVGASSIKCPGTVMAAQTPPTQNTTLKNMTHNGSSSLPKPLSIAVHEPLFSAETFFIFVFIVMLICEICFVLLNYLPKAKREQVRPKSEQPDKKVSKDEQRPLESHVRANSESVEPSELLELELTGVDKDSQSSLVSDKVYSETVEDTNDSPTLSMRMVLLVLLIQTYLNSVFNGVIPSVLTYACLPYGEKTYHLAVTLSAIANPVASLLYYVVVLSSVKYMAIWAGLYSILCAYVVGIAAESPCPLLHDSAGGSFLIVFIVFAGTALGGYLRTAMSTILRNQGRKALFWCGLSIQIGSFVGAIIMFPLVNIVKVFKQ